MVVCVTVFLKVLVLKMVILLVRLSVAVRLSHGGQLLKPNIRRRRKTGQSSLY